VDEEIIRELLEARRSLDVYRERDEAQSDCRVLLRILLERNTEITILKEQVFLLRQSLALSRS
jgi:hypothetical protein